MHTTRTPLQRYEQIVAEALQQDEAGATLNRIAARCGGSTSMTSQALTSLEAQNRGRFDGGRWYAVPAVVRPEEKQFVDGKVAAAGRVRQRRLA